MTSKSIHWQRYRPISKLIVIVFAFCIRFTSGALIHLIEPPSHLNASNQKYHCTNDVRWAGGQADAPDYYREDCNTAFNLFQRDVSRYGNRDTEWLSIGAQASRRVPVTQRTPKRYTYNTCVLALVMLKDVGDIPAKPAGPFGSRSMGTFRRVLGYVEDLYEDCLLESHQLGWTEFGPTSLGLFFWATESGINRRVPLILAEVNSTFEVE